MLGVGTESPSVIVLVDHRDLTRAALLRSIGEALPGITVIGATRVGDLSSCAREQLRAVILHIDHAETGNGSLVEVISAARAILADVPLVILSESTDGDSLRASIEGGANAHLTTMMPLDIVAATLRLVMVGGTSFPAPAFWGRRLTRRLSPDEDSHQVNGGRLTQREEDVLKLVGEGVQNKIIAFRLSMSENTVKVHLHRILQKLNLRNRTEVALLASSYFARGVPNGAVAPAPAEPQIMAPPPDSLRM